PQASGPQREKIPAHERARRLRGQELHPRYGGMDTQEQRLEVEPADADDDDLAVDDAALGERVGERRQELGEVSVHRLLVSALQQDLVAVAKHQRAKAVPLGLEQPAVPGGQGFGGARQHGLERRSEGQAHGPILASWSPVAWQTEGHNSIHGAKRVDGSRHASESTMSS